MPVVHVTVSDGSPVWSGLPIITTQQRSAVTQGPCAWLSCCSECVSSSHGHLSPNATSSGWTSPSQDDSLLVTAWHSVILHTAHLVDIKQSCELIREPVWRILLIWTCALWLWDAWAWQWLEGPLLLISVMITSQFAENGWFVPSVVKTTSIFWYINISKTICNPTCFSVVLSSSSFSLSFEDNGEHVWWMELLLPVFEIRTCVPGCWRPAGNLHCVRLPLTSWSSAKGGRFCVPALIFIST